MFGFNNPKLEIKGKPRQLGLVDIESKPDWQLMVNIEIM